MDEATYQLVRECFEHDDGSLPSVQLNNLSPPQIAAIYSYIRERSRVSTEAPKFWHRIEERSVALDAVPNAAALVANGEAEPLHFCFTGLRVGTMELPELGLFVFPDGVELDYRMGPHWTRAAIAAFFKLLQELCAMLPNATLGMPSFEVPPYPDRFLAAWARIRS